MKKEIITPQNTEYVRQIISNNVTHPVNGNFFRKILTDEIQQMIGWRVLRSLGESYADNPDNVRGLIYEQYACEIYKGKLIKAHTIWETHDDIRARGEIPSDQFRVSGDVFFVRNLPQVPIIRCGATPPAEDLPLLKTKYILLDPNLNVL